jgi:hypothetical protein
MTFDRMSLKERTVEQCNWWRQGVVQQPSIFAYTNGDDEGKDNLLDAVSGSDDDWQWPLVIVNGRCRALALPHYMFFSQPKDVEINGPFENGGQLVKDLAKKIQGSIGKRIKGISVLLTSTRKPSLQN